MDGPRAMVRGKKSMQKDLQDVRFRRWEWGAGDGERGCRGRESAVMTQQQRCFGSEIVHLG